MAQEVLPRERRLLAAALALGLLVRVAYALHGHDQPLNGDQLGYDAAGRLAAAGHWLWGTDPYGIPHPTFWKPPGYGIWLGAWYSVLGHHPELVRLLQALIGPVVIALTWLLTRRLTGSSRAALAAAFVAAVYPGVFQYEELLYSEALAVPATLAILVAGLDRTPTLRRAAAVGLLTGACLLIRPTGFIALAGIVAGWLVLAGWRRGAAAGAVAIACAALVLVPWTIRNADLSGAFVPLSVQDGAAAGTFNPTSAGDPDHPYAWRPDYPRDRDLFDRSHPLPEATILHELRSRAFAYIGDHPESVPAALFWNGIVRLWSLRPPSGVREDVRHEGGYPDLALLATLAYWVLAAAALVALWRWRRERRSVVVAVVVMAAVASVAFTPASGSRYRATLEPLIVVLACSLLAPRAPRRATAARAGASADAPSARRSPARPA